PEGLLLQLTAHRLGGWSWGAVGVIVPLAALELVSRTNLLPTRAFPPPTESARALAAALADPGFWSDVGLTLEGWAIGLALAAALRLASSVALILAVTSELVVGVPGLGRSINVAQSSGDYASMYALIAVAGMLGILLNETFRRVERRALRWHPAQRSA